MIYSQNNNATLKKKRKEKKSQSFNGLIILTIGLDLRNVVWHHFTAHTQKLLLLMRLLFPSPVQTCGLRQKEQIPWPFGVFPVTAGQTRCVWMRRAICVQSGPQRVKSPGWRMRVFPGHKLRRCKRRAVRKALNCLGVQLSVRCSGGSCFSFYGYPRGVQALKASRTALCR